jgi:hypothetical protein
MGNFNEEYWIRDYFGPYPIDWDLYDLAMGIKREKINIHEYPKNINEIYKPFKEKIKNPKK